MKIAVATLGCKINQFDTAVLHELALEKDHEIVDYADAADVYVINTCTVTGRADSDSRALIRKAKRTNPGAKVIVTGCYAQTHPDAIEAIPDVDLVLGNPSKFRFLEWIERGGEGAARRFVEPFQADTPFIQPLIRRHPGHTRAFLKVQEGCDDACAFCIVPLSRGMSRSLPVASVLEQVRLFADQGYREIVLTGVQLGCYGRDLDRPADLPSLLSRLLNLGLPVRYRLSSIHPTDVTDELIDRLASSDALCKHVHVSLQSGDDGILCRMKRDYDAAFYRERVETLARRIPEIGIGSDILVGFPGESDEAFENTCRLISELPLTYLHVFSFSPRPMTPAAAMTDSIPAPVMKERSVRLKTLAQAKSHAFCRKMIGRDVDVLIENERDPRTGRRSGLTTHYVRVALDASEDIAGGLYRVRVSGFTDGILIGELASRPMPPRAIAPHACVPTS